MWMCTVHYLLVVFSLLVVIWLFFEVVFNIERLSVTCHTLHVRQHLSVEILNTGRC